MARNYRKEYDNYQGKPEQVARRSSRNKARRKAVGMGLIKRKDKRDVDHKNSNPMDDRPSNLRALLPRNNRSFPRDKKAREL